MECFFFSFGALGLPPPKEGFPPRGEKKKQGPADGGPVDPPADQLFSKKKVFRKSALEMKHRTNLV